MLVVVSDHAREALAEAAKDTQAFEQRLKAALEERLFPRPVFDGIPRDHVWVSEVRLEGEYPDTELTMYLRDDRRPHCVFGWRAGPIWREACFEDSATPEDRSWWIALGLEEDVVPIFYGLPVNCESGRINWIQRHDVKL